MLYCVDAVVDDDGDDVGRDVERTKKNGTLILTPTFCCSCILITKRKHNHNIIIRGAMLSNKVIDLANCYN